ncbi:MAG: porin [Gemmobacter sp.]
MKKVLFATTALVLTAGMAMAEVKFSGSGRVGLTYNDGRDDINPDLNTTLVEVRLRFNIDASKETDAGVTFGGRIRMQYDEGSSAAGLSAAYVYAEANGFTVQVGNSDTAFDTVALMYNSEIGFVGNSQGNPIGSYYSFNSGANPTDDYIGIFAAYSVGDLNARLSFVTPDQTGAAPTGDIFDANREDEISVSFDYKVGQFTVALAAAQDAGGIADNDRFFLGAEYAINDSTNVGLLFNDNGIISHDSDGDPSPGGFGAAGEDIGNTVTLYGNTTLASGISLGGYVATIDNDIVEDDFAVGIEAGYDLGGATIGAGIEKRFTGETYADVGVNFSF